MIRAMRWAAGAVAITAILGSAAACGNHSASGKSSQPTAAKPLAVVNGQKLTQSNWKVAVHATDLLQGVQMSTSKSAEKQQVKELASEMAVEQYALKQKWVTQAKAAQEAKKFVNENVTTALGGSNAKAKVALKKKNLTMQSLTQFLTQQMELQAAFVRVTKNVKAPTTAQLQSYYNQHKSLFTTPPQDEMRMILVKKKSLAESIMTQLKNGGSWKTLAAKYSLDTYSKKKGGEYGWVNTGPQSGFVTNFYKEMDKLKPGQYGIAHTQYGYHVIEVQATKPSKVQSFSSVKSQLSSSLTQQKQDTAFKNFTKKIAKKTKIKINV